ncbi:unnamed protein product [Prorocentrum cordatum]|uniref:Uncharacterized protein n=1 Tax=Prorocentrum cordatum TaxID=2364126 RepID=A0ABN9TFY1_9DINO|nr:unnamed protein product [Polarella glacialis]
MHFSEGGCPRGAVANALEWLGIRFGLLFAEVRPARGQRVLPFAGGQVPLILGSYLLFLLFVAFVWYAAWRLCLCKVPVLRECFGSDQPRAGADTSCAPSPEADAAHAAARPQAGETSPEGEEEHAIAYVLDASGFDAAAFMAVEASGALPLRGRAGAAGQTAARAGEAS